MKDGEQQPTKQYQCPELWEMIINGYHSYNFIFGVIGGVARGSYTAKWSD